MRALLDTHAFLWWITNDLRISAPVHALIRDGRNEIYFSAASAWELAIKARLGRIVIADDLGHFVTNHVGLNGFQVLPIALPHALAVHALPDHHRDPFDRLLVAQCRIEDLALISVDAQIRAYGVEVLW